MAVVGQVDDGDGRGRRTVAVVGQADGSGWLGRRTVAVVGGFGSTFCTRWQVDSGRRVGVCSSWQAVVSGVVVADGGQVFCT